jgi:hypothetical protein
MPQGTTVVNPFYYLAESGISTDSDCMTGCVSHEVGQDLVHDNKFLQCRDNSVAGSSGGVAHGSKSPDRTHAKPTTGSPSHK